MLLSTLNEYIGISPRSPFRISATLLGDDGRMLIGTVAIPKQHIGFSAEPRTQPANTHEIRRLRPLASHG